jgi:hypothetical protein
LSGWIWINNKGCAESFEKMLVKKIESVFSDDFINEQGNKSQFIQRSSKITAVKFLDLLLYNSSQDQCFSLNRLSISAQTRCDVNISRQGLDQRMNGRAVAFVRGLLEKQLTNQVSENLDVGLMKHFNRVRIKDSTKFDIDEQLEEWFPGFKGCASSASACIQYEFDLKGGRVIDLDITPGNRPDAKDAQEKTWNIQKNDLFIRDLGYFALDASSNIIRQGAYFLSRLNFKTIVYEQIGGVLIELDFGKLYRHMKQHNIPRIEKQVLMGKEDKLPVRLVIELMPDQIYEQRVRKVKAYNRKKGHKTSTEYTDRARFNLFVTNASGEMLTSRAIPLFYKVRWQVELIFKIWKSTFGIHITRKMKIERFLCLLYSKLLLIMINWEIILVFRNNIYATTNRYLSIDKCFKTLKDNADKIYGILRNQDLSVEGLIRWVGAIFESKHWLEKRKNKMCYEEIINLNY